MSGLQARGPGQSGWSPSGGDRGRGPGEEGGCGTVFTPTLPVLGARAQRPLGEPLSATSSPPVLGLNCHCPRSGSCEASAGVSGRGSPGAEGPGQEPRRPNAPSWRRRGSAHPALRPRPTYHQEVVEQEDFALVQAKLLGLVRVRDLEEPAVADKAAVRQRQHLCGGAASARTPARTPRRRPRALPHGDRPPGAESRAWGRCPGEPPKRPTRAA